MSQSKAALCLVPLLVGLTAMPLYAADKKGGDHAGHGSAASDGGHGGMSHGGTMPMCHEGGAMPPHYCEPSYKVASSVLGVKVTDVAPMGDKSLMITLKTYGPLAGKAGPRLVVVGGGGDLAGGMVLDAGWKDGAMVHLDLSGEGNVYKGKGFHVHVFPMTGR